VEEEVLVKELPTTPTSTEQAAQAVLLWETVAAQAAQAEHHLAIRQVEEEVLEAITDLLTWVQKQQWQH
jgi:hypothetical protein